MRNPLVALALAPALLVPNPISAPSFVEDAAVGQPMPELEWTTMLGGDGRGALSAFRGQPVLIAWYSTVFAGLEAAKIAVELDEEHRDDGLVVILMEIKRHDATYLRALQMEELPGADCRLMRTQDLPIAWDDSTGLPPKMALVGVDGTLRYAGSYQRKGDLEDLLEDELKKREKGWGDEPRLREARALAWGRGRLGEARASLEPSAPASAVDARFEALAASVAHHLEHGEPGRAREALDALAAAAEGLDRYVARAAEVAAGVDADALDDALALERKLDSLLKPTRKRAPKKGLDDKLRAFAEGDASGTPVGARAARLADAVELALAGLESR